MADNSNNRKKTLIISMLVFLLGGGGIFLFFIIQGSNDLTGAGKSKFQYGTATREAVSSFFKVIGVVPEESDALAKYKETRMTARGFLADGEKAVPDVADWMDKSAAAPAAGLSGRSASPTSVPRMAGRAGSSVGGGGGSSQSAGAVSRFGGDGAQGNTAISARAQAGGAGANGKGTLGALKNAKAMLGEGLRSDSAMTASSKWNQSFGVGAAGGARSGDLAYGKPGLVGLDKIKSGEIASLKMTPAKSMTTPEAGAFKRDKDMESKDAGIQKAKTDAEADSKKAAAKAAAEAAAQALTQDKAGDTPKSTDKAAGDGKTAVPEDVKEAAKSLAIFEKTPLGEDGTTMQDSKVDITMLPDGTQRFDIAGEMTTSTGEKIPYTDVVVRGKDGTLTFK